jgi:hypothetical protein
LLLLDLVLPEVSDFDALDNTLLLFVGGEIMSIAKAELTGKACAAGSSALTGKGPIRRAATINRSV